ncbi:CoA-transferase subunit beta [Allorhizocola rhizosphaerae]|uniref:CoA-transferase subunit beta n=1 Tax=Allorhizocola rhizosphaerae TaxID=1872709 RepID=UPI000E3E9AC9|nr:CoA-transferase [Allorhizocola rhizosphaerae]
MNDGVLIAACADAWRGDGAILASPMGPLPMLGARLAQATFAPELMVGDGESYLLRDGLIEGWLPYRAVFTIVAAGRRHVMMGASQLDRHGNQNISCIGEWARPTSQLLGVRGAPGNTINHTTSYFVPKHTRRVFVERVDMVSGIGYDRAAKVGARFHEIRRVITDKAVLDFETPDRTMRLRSLHPGVSLDDVLDNTGFDLSIPDDVPTTRTPTPAELEIIERLAGGVRSPA